MRIVIIGGSHAGITAATNLKKISPDFDVTLIEKTDILGFIPSSINFVFSEYFPIKDLKIGEVTNAKEVAAQGIDVIMNTTVTAIDVAHKNVTAVNNESDVAQTITYDKLILAMGSAKFSVVEADYSGKTNQLLTYKYQPETRKAYTKLKRSKNITIIGAGLIGLELASHLSHYPDKQISIIEQMNRPMFRYFDEEITEELMQHVPESVHFIFGKTFASAKKVDRKLNISMFGGDQFETQAAVLALNPKPNVDLVEDSLKLAFDRTIEVNEHMQTSNPDVYAIGDLIRVPFGPKAELAYLPLIAIARKAALDAALHISGIKVNHITVCQRTIGSEVFGHYLGSTGVTYDEAILLQLKVTTFTKTFTHYTNVKNDPNFMLKIKVIYEEATHRMVGAQLITNRRDMLDIISTLAQAIANNKTVDSLMFFQSYYAPMLSPDQNYLAELGVEAVALKNNAKTKK